MNVAVGDGHAADAVLSGQGRRVVHVLVEDNRLGIGIGDRGGPARPARRHQPIGREVDALHLLRAKLADPPVLAELALDVAAGGRDRERRRAREVMKQRLLFNRVHVGRA